MPSNEDPQTGAALPIGEDVDETDPTVGRIRAARVAKEGQLTDDEVAGLTKREDTKPAPKKREKS